MKKKIIKTLLLSISLGMVSIMPNNIEETKANTITIAGATTTEGLGYSIDLTKDSYIDSSKIKLNNPIFDISWLGGLNKIKTVLNQTTTSINHANSIEKMVAELEEEANVYPIAKLNNSLFTATAATKFNDYDRIDYTEYVYQYYSTYNYKIKSYSYELENYSTNIANYKRFLSDEYIEDLEAFFYEEIDGTTFFEKYGTHVITKATYGGNFEINYSAASNTTDVWGEYYDDLTNYLNTELYSKVGVFTTIDFDPTQDLGLRPYYVPTKTQIRTYGGDDMSDLTTDLISANFDSWVSSVSNSPKIIETSNDGLIPLWNLLPTYYDTAEYRMMFINAYNEYASSNENMLLDLYYPSILNSSTGVETGYTIARVGDVTITDDGIFNQHYDVMDLNDDFVLKYDYMLEKGFTNMTIYLEFKAKEVNMGYQIISIYYSEKEDLSYEIENCKFEHEGYTLGTSYVTYCFINRNISINTFNNSDPEDYGKLVFRYSAEGNGEDDWMNREIYANIVYFK